jgi:hypothetical protein
MPNVYREFGYSDEAVYVVVGAIVTVCNDVEIGVAYLRGDGRDE